MQKDKIELLVTKNSSYKAKNSDTRMGMFDKSLKNKDPFVKLINKG
jgi:hypothetical protein